MFRPSKIISGGQTGADIGGLVGARRVGIDTGGTAPRGYKTEAGPQPDVLQDFGLVSHPSADYRPRTEQNVRDADATLIVATRPHSTGTRLTVDLCTKHRKPWLMIDPRDSQAITVLTHFLQDHTPSVLNVAGNRESVSPGLASATAGLLQTCLQYLPPPTKKPHG